MVFKLSQNRGFPFHAVLINSATAAGCIWDPKSDKCPIRSASVSRVHARIAATCNLNAYSCKIKTKPSLVLLLIRLPTLKAV